MEDPTAHRSQDATTFGDSRQQVRGQQEETLVYGVQEWLGYVGIEKLEGSYYNVMGLPVHKLYAHLKDF